MYSLAKTWTSLFLEPISTHLPLTGSPLMRTCRGLSEGVSGGPTHQVPTVLQMTMSWPSLRACTVASYYMAVPQKPLYPSLCVFPLVPATFSILCVYFYILLSASLRHTVPFFGLIKHHCVLSLARAVQKPGHQGVRVLLCLKQQQ